jgi:hypothetical protein
MCSQCSFFPQRPKQLMTEVHRVTMEHTHELHYQKRNRREDILPKIEMYIKLILINLKFYFSNIRKREHALQKFPKKQKTKKPLLSQFSFFNLKYLALINMSFIFFLHNLPILFENQVD